jgi:hypothetical protein
MSTLLVVEMDTHCKLSRQPLLCGKGYTLTVRLSKAPLFKFLVPTYYRDFSLLMHTYWERKRMSFQYDDIWDPVQKLRRLIE